MQVGSRSHGLVYNHACYFLKICYGARKNKHNDANDKQTQNQDDKHHGRNK